jgi:hypothetical protein
MVAITPKAHTWWVLCVLVLALPLYACAPARSGADSKRLFVIERSLNANIVVYDAVRGNDGRLDPAQPVAAYWLLKADKGQRQELNVFEKMAAYGFDVGNGPQGSVTIALHALKGRPIRVQTDGRRVLALTRIAGREVVLNRVFVQTEQNNPLGVKYIEIFGQDLRGRKPVHERIPPG